MVALLLFAGFHYAINWILRHVFPPVLAKALAFVEAVVGVFFLMVYVFLGWEMLTVFLPWLKRRPKAAGSPREAGQGGGA